MRGADGPSLCRGALCPAALGCSFSWPSAAKAGLSARGGGRLEPAAGRDVTPAGGAVGTAASRQHADPLSGAAASYVRRAGLAASWPRSPTSSTASPSSCALCAGRLTGGQLWALDNPDRRCCRTGWVPHCRLVTSPLSGVDDESIDKRRGAPTCGTSRRAAGSGPYNEPRRALRNTPSAVRTCAGFRLAGWGRTTTVPQDHLALRKQPSRRTAPSALSERAAFLRAVPDETSRRTSAWGSPAGPRG